MKNKLKGKSRKIKRPSSTSPKNLNLKIYPIDNVFRTNNLSQVRNSSSPKMKRIAHKPTKTEQMNWKQLKKKYPNMNPTADADFDGLLNARDCKPLDPSKDGKLSAFLGMIQGDKQTAKGLVKAIAARQFTEAAAERKAKSIVKKKGFIGESRKKRIVKAEALKRRFSSKIADAVETVAKRITPTTRREVAAAKARRGKGIVKAVERFAGVRKSSQKKGKASKGQKQAGAGRPKQSFKYRDPRTGQPISAVEYHRLRKQLKSQAKAVETQTEVKQRFALARRGLSPEEVDEAQAAMNAKMAKLRAIKDAKQEGIEVQSISEQEVEEQLIQEEAQQIPEQVIQQVAQQAQPTSPVQSRQYQPQYPQGQRVQHIERMTAVPGSYGIPPGYRVRDNLMTGEKTLVPLPPREAWSR